ncbi:copper homeostasis protein cutC homolog [Harpegnathos saltator]|uniref:Copper homeostasis protein cutC homolog n=1 Tax=Harpegnathos saltator TaxID=610380 RepID=E2C1L5_HARSA|nr:copper homeostasis protein cutC homolog [Harpegnathos saltator]EFN78191.1 Copper homeostasis protein cutC-like protein [Harpegnathos saltator]
MEICIDCLESARNAVAGGATRLEVCSALSEGGLTPSPGLVRQIKNFAKIPIRAMIRIRKGNFVYSREEIDAMLHDLRILKDHQVDGFVFGALTLDGHVDLDVCCEIVSVARPLPVTFHRAFDETVDPLKSMESIIDLGFDRILTSGQKDTALQGLSLLKRLVDKAADRIVIMPGAGIARDNISQIKQCGAREFHASARKKVYVDPNGHRFAKDNFIDVTDRELVQTLVDIVHDVS